MYILIGKPQAIGLMDTGSWIPFISLNYAKRHQIKIKLAAGYVSIADILLERVEKMFFFSSPHNTDFTFHMDSDC